MLSFFRTHSDTMMKTRKYWTVLVVGLGWWWAASGIDFEASGEPGQDLPFLIDVADQAGIIYRHVRGGSGKKYMPETFSSGGAFFDYDNDGWLDIYFVNGAALPGFDAPSPPTNVLYRNNRDGTFTDATALAGVGDPSYGMGCAVGDYDNDGLLDLYVTNFGADILYRNNGDGTFSDWTSQAGLGCELWGSSAGFGDIDNDGDLDLYVANYVNFGFDIHKTCADSNGKEGYCHPSVYDGLPDVLYLNEGDGTFADVTESAGLSSANGRGLGVVFGDYDNDGDADVYVANDTVRNNLWNNQGDGTFEDVGLMTGVAFSEAGVAEGGMGTDFGDFDDDGALDIVVANYDMETNTIYRNTGHDFFSDVTDIVGIGARSLPYVGFGTGFFDYDNDRDLDIFVANGHIMEEPSTDEDDSGHEQPDMLFRNTAGGKFENVSLASGDHFSTRHSSRGAAFGDYDNDGDVDILVANSNTTANLLRNEGGNRNHKLMVGVVGTESNRDGIGARLVLTSGKGTHMREVHGAYSYCAANDLRVHFGLGSSETVEHLEVRWPSGRVEILEDLTADRWIVIKEGSGIVESTVLK